jgi:hypothetical protein
VYNQRLVTKLRITILTGAIKRTVPVLEDNPSRPIMHLKVLRCELECTKYLARIV